MSTHLRANLWLLLFTLVLCAAFYPLALLGVGQALFHENAQGSLIKDKADNVIGSRLIARPLAGDEYFQPRPSDTGGDKAYNAAASGANNWGASNYKLRNRVARLLGPIVRYGPGARKDGKEPGELVGPDVEKWFQKDRYKDAEGKELPGLVARWAKRHSGLAEDWAKDTGKAVKDHWLKSADAAVKAAWEKKSVADSFAEQWREDFPKLYAQWRKDNPTLNHPSTADLAGGFFEHFAAAHPGFWPYLDDEETKDGQKQKKINLVKESTKDQNEIQVVFFDLWRQDHPQVDLLEVPADMVTASASGLDPHITRKNADYQARYRMADALLDRFVRDGKLQADEGRRKGRRARIVEEIGKLLDAHAAAPLGGLVGVPLVNVLEVNVALRDALPELARKIE